MVLHIVRALAPLVAAFGSAVSFEHHGLFYLENYVINLYF